MTNFTKPLFTLAVCSILLLTACGGTGINVDSETPTPQTPSISQTPMSTRPTVEPSATATAPTVQMSSNQKAVVEEMVATVPKMQKNSQYKNLWTKAQSAIPGSPYAFETVIAASFLAKEGKNGWKEVNQTSTQKTGSGTSSATLTFPAKNGVNVDMALAGTVWKVSLTGGKDKPVCVVVPQKEGGVAKAYAGACSKEETTAAFKALMAIAIASLSTQQQPAQ